MFFKKVNIYILLLGFYCLPSVVLAQTISIKGIIFKNNSGERIAQATVTDLKTGVLMMSDELGSFNIQTAKGDTLLFSKKDFTPQKLVIVSISDVVIYMQPVIQLNEVTIKDKTQQQELNDVVNTYRSKGLYFDGKPPALIFNPFGGSPVTGFYELFSKDASNERRFIKFSKAEMEQSEVTRRYNKQLVKQVTALPDTDVMKFMQQYTPSPEDMKEWNDYELISHIKKYLEYYKTHRDAIPMQKLY